MGNNKKELYIHIPFCKSKCIYCDFVSYRGQDDKIDFYLKNLATEMLEFKNSKISTIFIGGGTPSILTIEQMSSLFKSLAENFDLSELEEFTIEANPESLTIEKICFLKQNEFVKVDRISLGLQSFDNEILANIGRHYSFEKFWEKFLELRREGFDNINIDLITSWSFLKKAYGSQRFLDDLANFLSDKKYQPEHISLYMLSVPGDSKLQKMLDNTENIDTDNQIDEYLAAIKILKKAGYLHYEISNFAKENRECKHNLGYWNRQEYIGLGANACGFINESRYKNPSSLDEYFEMTRCGTDKYHDFREIEKLTDHDRFVEELSLGLRLLQKGILLDGKIDYKVKRLVNDGYLKIEGKNVLLTEKGICVSNSIFADLIDV